MVHTIPHVEWDPVWDAEVTRHVAWDEVAEDMVVVTMALNHTVVEWADAAEEVMAGQAGMVANRVTTVVTTVDLLLPITKWVINKVDTTQALLHGSNLTHDSRRIRPQLHQSNVVECPEVLQDRNEVGMILDPLPDPFLQRACPHIMERQPPFRHIVLRHQ